MNSSSYSFSSDSDRMDSRRGYNNSSNSNSNSNVPIIASMDETYTLSIFIYLTIGFIYVCLLSLLVDKVLQSEKIDKMCGYSILIDMNDQNRSVEDKKCDAIKEHNKKQKFTYMIVIGLISMLM